MKLNIKTKKHVEISKSDLERLFPEVLNFKKHIKDKYNINLEASFIFEDN